MVSGSLTETSCLDHLGTYHLLERVKQEVESEKGRSKELESNRTGKGGREGRQNACNCCRITANARYRRPAT